MFKEKHNRSTLKSLSPYSADTLPLIPPETGPAPSRLVLFAALFAYLLFGVPTVHLAFQAYTPCETNFEGGCSMGHYLLALGSFATAAGAWGFGVLLARTVMAHPCIAPLGDGVGGLPAVGTADALYRVGAARAAHGALCLIARDVRPNE